MNLRILIAVALGAIVAVPASVSAGSKVLMPDFERGDEVDVTSGSVTGLSCALEARRTGKLELLQNCPLEESLKGIVIYDVTEEMILALAPGVVARYKLESAYGGGSLDVIGEVKKIDRKTGIATVEVEEYSVTKKPKAGGFKGCL